MKFEQVAIVDGDGSPIKQQFMDMGHTTWSTDIVVAKGYLRQLEQYIPIENVAKLAFNYTIIPGTEYELIRYVSGENFLAYRSVGMMSHIAFHADDIEEARRFMEQKFYKVIQEVVTISHASTAVGSKHYHYIIFDGGKMHHNIKIIKRLPDVYSWETAQQKLEERYA